MMLEHVLDPSEGRAAMAARCWASGTNGTLETMAVGATDSIGMMLATDACFG